MTPKTLDQFTPEQWANLVGMWTEWRYGDGQMELVVIEEISTSREYVGCVIPGVRYIEIPAYRLHKLTPRFDLPRAWTPDGKPVPGEWDDDNGHNLMRRFRTEWEWKQEVSQDFIGQYEGRRP